MNWVDGKLTLAGHTERFLSNKTHTHTHRETDREPQLMRRSKWKQTFSNISCVTGMYER